MRLLHLHKYFISIGFICFLLSTSLFSLSTDKNKKVYVISDHAIYNFKTGLSVFVGHVKVNQGSTHLRADRLTLQNEHHEIKEAIAYGLKNNLAHYWTLPKIGDKNLFANAKIIKFYPIASKVTLEKNVILDQGTNHFQGQLLYYDIKDQTIQLPPSENGKAVLIYNPDESYS